jgi:tetratricopeptide (TPR) repeat protein
LYIAGPDRSAPSRDYEDLAEFRESGYPALMAPAAAAPYYRGLNHLARFNWSEAVDELERARRAEGGSIHIDFHLARAYFHAGHQAKARTHIVRALRVLRPKGRVEQAEARAAVALAHGDLESFGDALENLADYFPNNPIYLFALFDARVETTNPALARTVLERIRDRFPSLHDDPRLHLAEARLLLREGRLQQALASAQVAAKPDYGAEFEGVRARAILSQMDALITLGRIDDARATLNEARTLLEFMTRRPESTC